ncbi:plasmid replication, integration and excision activator [Phytoactinopolyspora mesophila]|uniref:plasmid replication, integration and excision activator n=1 Tax=Phytoactinopolyspora mesophila TaxID=2650750 RepID=UPI001390E8D7|nr:plasmid replication, integration and excision activator [Phytoactinopolyspora mesophila]
MALQGAIPVEFGAVFPHGAFVIGEVTAEADFDASTKDNRVQKRDKVSGLPVWQVPVMDADPDARKGQRELTVKIAAEVQPVPPEILNGTPFRPVEFEGLTVTPYVDTNGPRARGLPGAFRTAPFADGYAASCRFRYSLRTSCGVL